MKKRVKHTDLVLVHHLVLVHDLVLEDYALNGHLNHTIHDPIVGSWNLPDNNLLDLDGNLSARNTINTQQNYQGDRCRPSYQQKPLS